MADAQQPKAQEPAQPSQQPPTAQQQSQAQQPQAQDPTALQRQPGAEPTRTQQLSVQRIIVPCDVFENDNEYLVLADLPGLDTENFDFIVRGDRIELRGERIAGDQRIVYERSFALPNNADPNDIEANYRDGVARITIAKTQESRPRRIPVHT